MFVVVVPVATAAALAVGVAIFYIAVGLAAAMGMAAAYIGEIVASAFGLAAERIKLPKADPSIATGITVVYFFYIMYHLLSTKVQWNYVTLQMLGSVLLYAIIKTVIAAIIVSIIAQIISLTELFHVEAPGYIVMLAVLGALLHWADLVDWHLYALVTIPLLVLYCAATRSRYTRIPS